jgi:uncharacterized repeat protein (TIGR01451 family)
MQNLTLDNVIRPLLLGTLLLVGTARAALPPVITVQPANTNTLVGGTAGFSVSVTSFTTPYYQWYFGSSPLSGATASSCTLNNVQAASAGGYYVTIRNTDGTVTSSTATLTVFGKGSWAGNGANNNWSSGGNWTDSAVPPNNGTAQIVLAGSTRPLPNVDTSWDLLGLAFSNNASAFTLAGSPLNLRGNGLTNNSFNPQTINNPITLAATANISSAAGSLTFGGNFMGGANTWYVGGTGNVTFAGALSGSGLLIENGTGALTLAASNAFSGSISVNSGVLVAQNSAAFGSSSGVLTVYPGAAVQLKGNIAVGAESLTLRGPGVSHDGALRNVTGTNSWGGTISLAADSTVSADAGGLTLGGPLINGGYNLTVMGAGNITLNGTVSGVGALTKTGPGTLTISGASANTFSGPTLVNGGTLVLNKTASKSAMGGSLTIGDALGGPNADVVRWNANEQILDGTGVSINSSGWLDLNGYSQTIASLTMTGGVVTTAAGTLKVAAGITANPNANPATISGNLDMGSALTFTVADGPADPDLAISAVIVGGTLTKAGPGKLVLSGNNAYSGNTTVSAGTLAVDNLTGSGTSAGNVTVQPGSVLCGTGTIGGPVVINGTLSAGDTGPGTLTTGPQTWSPNSTNLWHLNRADGSKGSNPGWDWLNINGPVTISATPANRITLKLTTLNLAGQPGLATNFNNLATYTWPLATATGGFSGFATNEFVLDTSSFQNALGGGSFTLVTNGNDLDLVFANTSADVATTQTGPANVLAGGLFTYTITLTNGGPATAVNVVLSDLLPPQATFLGASGGYLTNGTVLWPPFNLPVGSNASFSVTVKAPANGPITNVVSSSASSPDPVAGNNNGTAAAAQVLTTITPVADLSVLMTGPVSGVVGASYNYTILVNNLGPSTATSVVVTDSLPAGVNFVSATAGGNTNGAGAVTWPPIPALAAGASTSLVVSVVAPAAGVFTHGATAGSATLDPVAGNNNSSNLAAQVATTIQVANISTNGATCSATSAGNSLSWLHVVNPGANRVLVVEVAIQNHDVAVTSLTYSNLPLTHIGGTNNNSAVELWSLTNPPIGTNNIVIKLNNNADFAAGALNFTGVDQANPFGRFAGATGDGSLATVTLASAAGDLVVDALAIQSGSVVTPVPPQVQLFQCTGNNITGFGSVQPGAPSLTMSWTFTGRQWSLLSVPLHPATADVIVTGTGPANVLAGSPMTYTLTVSNAGPSDAPAVSLLDTLPAGVTFSNASGGGVFANGVVAWPPLGLLARGTATNFTVLVIAGASGPLTNVVAGGAVLIDPALWNNNGTAAAAQTVTGVTPSADVATTITGPASVPAGSNFTVIITVTNLGPSAAAAVVVSGSLPAGLQFVSATAGGLLSGGVVTWPPLPSLAYGAASNFSVTLMGSTSGTFRTIVSSAAATSDPNGSNDDGSAPTAQLTTVLYTRSKISGQRLSTGAFQIQFATVPNQTCRIQASTNLVAWQTLLTTNSPGGIVVFIDPEATNYPVRFYRGNLLLP